MMLIRIQTQVTWQAARDPKSDRWVAVCQPLGITAEAETWDKLAALMNEEVNELLRDLLEEGELPHFLKERGWVASPLTPVPHAMPREGVAFDVPMEIQIGALAAALAKNAAHAQA